MWMHCAAMRVHSAICDQVPCPKLLWRFCNPCASQRLPSSYGSAPWGLLCQLAIVDNSASLDRPKLQNACWAPCRHVSTCSIINHCQDIKRLADTVQTPGCSVVKSAIFPPSLWQCCLLPCCQVACCNLMCNSCCCRALSSTQQW